MEFGVQAVPDRGPVETQIKAILPQFHYDEIVPTDSFGNPTPSVQGLRMKVEDLRFHRAATFARVKQDYRSLQVETLRFAQQRTDEAYEAGMKLLAAGRLTPRLSPREALGNYIDRQVRERLRKHYDSFNIGSAGKGPVRVNRRENVTSEADQRYGIPDSRVQDVAFDVTLTKKTLAMQQVRRFFDADFRPSRVVIVRPSQMGAGHTYAISRPETKR